MAPDGSLYSADYVNDRIRRVGLDGIITTVAGNPHRPVLGDGGPATAARLDAPTGVALGPDGSFYIADSFNRRIRRVGPDGIITTVAGRDSGGFAPDGDGGAVTAARFHSITGIALAADGSLYLSDDGGPIRRVGSDGIITTVAGNGNFGGDGGPATAADIGSASGVALAPGGSLYIVDGRRIRRVSWVLPGLAIASPDGAEVYVSLVSDSPSR